MANVNYGTSPTAVSLEEAYKLGFEDATQGKDFGASTTAAAFANARRLERDDDEDLDPLDYISSPPPTTPKQSSSFGFSQLMSIGFIYRTVTELGGNPVGGDGFSMERALANLRVMDTMKWGILGFSLYNLVKVFF